MQKNIIRKPSGKTYPSLMVWAAAAAAYRINNREYYKEPVHDKDLNLIVKPNKAIMVELLHHQENITELDILEGRRLYDHVRGWILKLFDSNCKDFIKEAVQYVDVEVIDQNDFGFMACLPNSIRRDIDDIEIRNTIERLCHNGPIGRIGHGIEGHLSILQSFPSKRYEGFVVRGNLDDHYVWFFSSTGFTRGNKYAVRARVKRHQEDGSTQLNYVRIITP